MLKTYSIFFLVFLIVLRSNAQEIQAKVTVNASRINTTVDKKVFVTLQNQLINFINSRKWTNDQFNENEKIQCSFLINLQSIVEPNVYRATLIIQAARPVYNASYQTALVNFQDQDFTFKYIEYQPIEFNENRVQGTDALAANLTSMLAYYVNIILGLDYDSFSPKAFNREVPNTMIVEFLLQTQLTELIGIFKNATSDEKAKAVEVLSQLDVANASRYKDELR